MALRTQGDIKRKGLPWLAEWAAGLRRGRDQAARAEGVSQPSLPPQLAPDSALIEACMALRAGLAADQAAPPPSPLALVGTTAPGCALTAAGLALVLAGEGRETLLVDANLRAPQLQRLFGLSVRPGFADLLAACQREQGPGEWGAPQQLAERLYVLPAGVPPGALSALLRPAVLGAALANLAARYEAVIIAVAEQDPSPDAALIAGAAGAAVVVVSAGSASPDELRRSRARLERAGVCLLGFTYVEGAGQ